MKRVLTALAAIPGFVLLLLANWADTAYDYRGDWVE